MDIIKTILGYLLIAAPETLKEWKVAIMLVEQGYESTEEQHNYKMSTETIYGGQGQSMDIGKSNNNSKATSKMENQSTSIATSTDT